jgi:hypothetical protein
VDHEVAQAGVVTAPRRIGLLLFDEVEVLDARGPLLADAPAVDLAVATARQMDHPWTREPEGAVR